MHGSMNVKVLNLYETEAWTTQKTGYIARSTTSNVMSFRSLTRIKRGSYWEQVCYLSMNWHLARGSGPCMLLQWSKSKPSSVLSPSRRQLNFMANGRSWPISGYGSSSRAVLAHSWKSSGSKPRISRCSKASLIQVRAVSSGPTLNVLHYRQKFSFNFRTR